VVLSGPAFANGRTTVFVVTVPLVAVSDAADAEFTTVIEAVSVLPRPTGGKE
jgi:hypothetical protein